MRRLRWLIPGLKVKRWFVLALSGVIIAGGGFFIISGTTLLSVLEQKLRVFSRWFDSSMLVLIGFMMVTIGLILFVLGFSRCVKSILKTLAPEKEDRLLERIYQRKYLEKGPKIVAIGGGTGLSVLLRGLKEHTSNITAIVTVTDDGGSSGILKGDFDILPPGDIRNCLVALADTESSMRELFDYRFERGKGLAGHSLGNLLLTAMSEMKGDFYRAVQEVAKVLAVRGRVIPSTLSKVTLGARTAGGSIIYGETNISNSSERIERVFLVPRRCRPPQEAVDAIMEADAVVLGPGSLYTSIIPNLLVRGIGEVLERTKAAVFYVCNVMTQPGETDGFDAADHLEALIRHAGSTIVDYVILNKQEVPEALQKKYREENSFPVVPTREKLEEMGVQVIEDFLVDECNYVRHDSRKLAQLILDHIAYHNGKTEGPIVKLK